jgi:hypothetical protein
MNLIGVHFRLRRAFLDLLRKPEETREARGLRLLGEAVRPALVALVTTELKDRPLTPEEIADLMSNE